MLLTTTYKNNKSNKSSNLNDSETVKYRIKDIVLVKTDNILTNLFGAISGLYYSIIGFNIIGTKETIGTKDKLLLYNIFDGKPIKKEYYSDLTGSYTYCQLKDSINIVLDTSLKEEINKFVNSKLAIYQLFKYLSDSNENNDNTGVQDLYGVQYILSLINNNDNNDNKNIIEDLLYDIRLLCNNSNNSNNSNNNYKTIADISTKTLTNSKLETNGNNDNNSSNNKYKEYLRRNLYMFSKLLLEDSEFSQLVFSNYITNRNKLLEDISNTNIVNNNIITILQKWLNGQSSITTQDISLLNTYLSNDNNNSNDNNSNSNNSIKHLPSNILVEEKPSKEVLTSIRTLYQEIYDLTRILNTDINDISKSLPILNLQTIVDNINILSNKYLTLPDITCNNSNSGYIIYNNGNSTNTIDINNKIITTTITTRNFDLTSYSKEELVEILYHIDTLVTSDNQYKYNNLRTAITNQLALLKN